MVRYRPKWRQIIASLVLVLILAASAPAPTQAASEADALRETLELVIDVIKQWHKDSATFDDKKLMEAAIKGAVDSVGDPYTNYFPVTEYSAFLDSLEGTFSGVGMYLENEDRYIVVAAPVKNTPAWEAGIQTGDRILEANGQNLVGEPVEKATTLIRGEPGTQVKLKLERPSEGRVFELTLTRRSITLPSVESELLEGGLGYIELSQFSSDTPTKFFAAVRELEKAGARGFIIDLRNNPGGYLDAAVEIAHGFVGKGLPIVVTEGKGGRTSTRTGTTDARVILKPIVMLVNNGSASASEILAGVFQDYKIGKLVGTKTFGKGTVQQLLGLNTGAGVKVTVEEYYTAKRNKVHGVGLTPDVEVQPYKPDPERTGNLETDTVIGLGEVSLRVQRIQNRLNDLGYDVGDELGHFNGRLLDKVHQFQRDHNLPQADVMDKPFLEALNAEVAKAVAKATKADVQLDKARELLESEIKKRG